MPDQSKLVTVPVGPLRIVALSSCTTLGQRVDRYISRWRKEREDLSTQSVEFTGYEKDSYLVNVECTRFASGEAKGVIKDSVRGADLYILVDVINSSVEYNLGGRMVPMSPDEHFADVKRIIAASAGKARRINVIMPFLYESRQDKRASRESLDCAIALADAINLYCQCASVHIELGYLSFTLPDKPSFRYPSFLTAILTAYTILARVSLV